MCAETTDLGLWLGVGGAWIARYRPVNAGWRERRGEVSCSDVLMAYAIAAPAAAPIREPIKVLEVVSSLDLRSTAG